MKTVEFYSGSCEINTLQFSYCSRKQRHFMFIPALSFMKRWNHWLLLVPITNKPSIVSQCSAALFNHTGSLHALWKWSTEAQKHGYIMREEWGREWESLGKTETESFRGKRRAQRWNKKVDGKWLWERVSCKSKRDRWSTETYKEVMIEGKGTAYDFYFLLIQSSLKIFSLILLQ